MAVAVLGFLGVLALLGSGSLFVQAAQARRGILVQGTVVANKISYAGAAAGSGRDTLNRGPAMAAPIVEYTDHDGHTHRIASRLSNSRLPPVGSAISVSYRRQVPGKAVVLLPGMAAAKWVFLVVGLACAAGAIAASLR